jgi:hypothetical protein
MLYEIQTEKTTKEFIDVITELMSIILTFKFELIINYLVEIYLSLINTVKTKIKL